MRCIFCKQDSSSSKSVEHIIPESLGNVDHTLPPGVVCDQCNNYIARKIEKPILDSLYFRERRFNMDVPSKKGRIPPIDGIHLQSLTHIQLIKQLKEFGISVGAAPNVDESRWVSSLQNQKTGTLIIPASKKPEDYLLSRFIAKIGLEVLALRVLDAPNGLDEIIDKPELDGLRKYVRYGNSHKIWPFSFRSLYSPDSVFHDKRESYEVLHEFDILVTEKYEFYVAVAIFGDEYVLNLGGPEIEGYEEWLRTHNYQSPLYFGKNS